MLLSAVSLHNRPTQVVAAALCLAAIWFLSSDHFSSSTRPTSSSPFSIPNISPFASDDHPIDRLILQAQEDFGALLNKETRNVEDAAKAYRARRGRHPPPWFDVWFEFASNRSAVVVEDFFDRIYEDLNPFWAIPATQLREQANDYTHKISVRNGTATPFTDLPLEDRPWVALWRDMVKSVEQYLPDVDMPINQMDESRMIVPWEDMNEYMAKATRPRKEVPLKELKTEFRSWKELDQHPPPHFDPIWDSTGPYWEKAVVGCAPDSPARKAGIETDFTKPPPLSKEIPPKSYRGYVQNWTITCSPCEHPDLQGLHGTFIEPISMSNTRTLFPLFGGSKLPMNNEILIPAPMYWTDDPFYSGGDSHGDTWEQKRDDLIWRGTASGGRNKVENWARFQRHRFVSMLNATSIRTIELHPQMRAPNFVLPNAKAYNLAAASSGPADLSDWVATWSDAALVNLECFPNPDPPHCSYTDPYFSVAKPVPMAKQYAYKYLPDIDGNSYSGRYRGFLRSTSLPIKATIYKEWHDDRLVPWVHFVPMDNTYIDIYGIMEYFVGNKQLGVAGHDEAAKTIALGGKEWAEKTLRKEDMSIWIFRVLLEFARLCDDDRDGMGWKPR